MLTRLAPAGSFAPVCIQRLIDSPFAVGFKAGIDAPEIWLATLEFAPPPGATAPSDDSAEGEGHASRVNVVTLGVVVGVPDAAPLERAKLGAGVR